MKIIIILCAIFTFSLDFYAQDMEPVENINTLDSIGFNLEIDKKSYTLNLAKNTIETGYKSRRNGHP